MKFISIEDYPDFYITLYHTGNSVLFSEETLRFTLMFSTFSAEAKPGGQLKHGIHKVNESFSTYITVEFDDEGNIVLSSSKWAAPTLLATCIFSALMNDGYLTTDLLKEAFTGFLIKQNSNLEKVADNAETAMENISALVQQLDDFPKVNYLRVY